MARRNIFQHIKEAGNPAVERPSSSGYMARGARGNMLASINELAETAAKADQVVEGASVVELDPELIDSSFVSDRMEDDNAFGELVEAIRGARSGFTDSYSPPSGTTRSLPDSFGHRRARAAPSAPCRASS